MKTWHDGLCPAAGTRNVADRRAPRRGLASRFLQGLAALFAAHGWLAGCGDDFLPFSDVDVERTLLPGANPFGPKDPLWAPQPRRLKPQQVVATPDGRFAVVSLPGTVDDPGVAVAVVDLERAQVVGRVEVGAAPFGLALHPGGRWLVVTLRTSNHLVVVDLLQRTVAARLATDFYTVGAAFDPAGERLVLTNRWRDAVAIWHVEAGDDGLRVTRRGPWLTVADNPRDVAVSANGRFAAVGALTGLEVAIVDLEADAISHRVKLGAPTSGVAFVGDFVVATTQSASTHHPHNAGPDGDGDGKPGDGTPNVNFQDLQNELAVIDPVAGLVVQRATSDSLVGRDYRDVDPSDAARGGALLPASALRIVGGALPEGIAAGPDAHGFVVGYSASDEVQAFGVDPVTGALSARGGAKPAGGHQPMGVCVSAAPGRPARVLLAHRLGETLGVLDAATLAPIATVSVGDVSGGAFPSTDAEIGELVNFTTAPLTVDGDQSCAHCHREDGNIDKAFSMPLLARPGLSSRMTMAYRGAGDSRPWFHEAAMGEHNFLPVLNEFARVENFCCTDYTLFGAAGAPADCQTSPPPVCASAPNASSANGFAATRKGREAYAWPRPRPFLDRDSFLRATMLARIGRDKSFGDALRFENPVTGERSPLVLDMHGLTQALGLFLLVQPRLLPNPNPRTAAAKRGEALFWRPDVGCGGCHPPPTFARSENQLGGSEPPAGSLRMRPVVSPRRDAAGINLDLLAEGFAQTFPAAEMDRCGDLLPADWCAKDPAAADALREVRFGVPSLRGIWDRARGMLHHGMARGLREVLCTPGHPALRPGEVGRNERDGMPDTHGGTSHLSPQQIEDLKAFLRTL